MRTVPVELKVNVVMTVDEGVDIADVINDLDCSISSRATEADVVVVDITDYEVKDSR
jgi:hypothetical protein